MLHDEVAVGLTLFWPTEASSIYSVVLYLFQINVSVQFNKRWTLYGHILEGSDVVFTLGHNQSLRPNS